MKINPIAYAKGKEDYAAGKTLAEVVEQGNTFEQSDVRGGEDKASSYIVGFLEGPLAAIRERVKDAVSSMPVRGG